MKYLCPWHWEHFVGLFCKNRLILFIKNFFLVFWCREEFSLREDTPNVSVVVFYVFPESSIQGFPFMSLLSDIYEVIDILPIGSLLASMCIRSPGQLFLYDFY